MLFIELWQFVWVEKKEKNLRHISQKRTRRQRQREWETRQGKQKHTEKRSLFNASHRLKKCWTQWKRCCCLLELSVLLFLSAHSMFVLYCSYSFSSFAFLFRLHVCERIRIVARLRSRDLFLNIVLFFDILMIMMRQLFKSRHIHALVKRPRRTCIMITSHKFATNDISSSSRSFACSFSFAHSRRLLCLFEGTERIGGKECAPEKNLMLKYLWLQLLTWKMNYHNEAARSGDAKKKAPVRHISTPVTIQSVVWVTNLHKIWRWQLAQTQTTWN